MKVVDVVGNITFDFRIIHWILGTPSKNLEVQNLEIFEEIIPIIYYPVWDTKIDGDEVSDDSRIEAHVADYRVFRRILVNYIRL